MMSVLPTGTGANLAGKGGLLTSIGGTAGLNGTGAADAQGDAFAAIAARDAMRLSETFQRSIGDEVLARNFPGQPRLAYFQIAATAQEDLNAYTARVAQLAAAGYITDAAEVSEKLGMTLTVQAPALSDVSDTSSISDFSAHSECRSKNPVTCPTHGYKRCGDIPKISREQFDARMKKGEIVEAKNGAFVTFGRLVATHHDNPEVQRNDPKKFAEYQKRKEQIDQAINVVETGTWEQGRDKGKTLDYYYKEFGKNQTMVVIADPETNEVWDYYVVPTKNLGTVIRHKKIIPKRKDS